MESRRGTGGRRAAVVIASLLASGGIAASAAGEHSLLELVSTGPAGGNGAADSEFHGASSDGARVFFDTRESLVSSYTSVWVSVSALISDSPVLNRIRAPSAETPSTDASNAPLPPAGPVEISVVCPPERS